MIYNRIPVKFCGLRKINLPEISYQHDIVQYLVFTDLELPNYYRVDFCNEGDTVCIPMTGDSTGVQIPDEFMLTGKPVIAYVVLTGVDECAVETRFEARLPIYKRPPSSDIEPTPAEQQEIDSLISALNDGVTRSETAAGAAEGAARRAATSEVNAAESERQAAGSATAAGESKTAAETAQGKAEDAQEKAEEAQGKAEDAQDAAERYASDANADAERAEQAAANAGYMDVHIDDNGHLIYTRTDAVDIDFELIDGHLIMEAV